MIKYSDIEITGSLNITGSLLVNGEPAGQGSASPTASYALTASYVDTVTSASYALTASYVDTVTSASYALTASYVDTVTSASYALTASYVDTVTSASYAATSSVAVKLLGAASFQPTDNIMRHGQDGFFDGAGKIADTLHDVTTLVSTYGISTSGGNDLVLASNPVSLSYGFSRSKDGIIVGATGLYQINASIAPFLGDDTLSTATTDRYYAIGVYYRNTSNIDVLISENRIYLPRASANQQTLSVLPISSFAYIPATSVIWVGLFHTITGETLRLDLSREINYLRVARIAGSV